LKGTSKLKTAGRSAMSRPRAATSVATSRSTSPALKAARAFSRSSWLLSPCSAWVFRPSRSKAARQPGGAQLGIDEDDGLRQLAVAQHLADHGALVVVGGAEEALLYRGRGGVRPGHLHQQRVLQVAGRERLISGEKVAENSRVCRSLGR
jgi:hypothetical protein